MERLGFDLILLGAPAAGKDTQAAILMRRFRLKPVESGKHWRRLAARNDALGRLLHRTFSKGQPTPVKLMKKFLVSQVSAAPKSRDLIFIGNPRLKPEAQLLAKLLKLKGRDYLAIAIDLPVDQVRKRSLARMRDDQDWKYVGNRIRMYRLQVRKTILYFKGLDKLRIVDGNRPVAAVAKDILKIINDYQRSQANRASQGKRPNTGRSFKPGRKQG
jgi:adenylate kinase family enzyme